MNKYLHLFQYNKYYVLLKFFKSFFVLILFVLQQKIVFSYEKSEAEKVNFSTANPFSFYHIITDLENQESQNAYGILRFPESRIKNKYPLILGVNGSKNWADHHLEYMEMYRKMGFATFEIKSFNSRNVNSTVGD